MHLLGRLLGLLLSLPFVPLIYAAALLRSAWQRCCPVESPAKLPSQDTVSLAMQALALLQQERESRGLDPLECTRIEVSYGDFDGVHIEFGGDTLSDGSAEGLRLIGALGNFELAPKIQATVQQSQIRQRIQALRSGVK